MSEHMNYDISPDEASQAIRYRGYMIMTDRLKVICLMTLNQIRPDQVLSKW